MDLVDKAFFRWQMLNQPRRFRESLAAARDELVCALSRHERTAELLADLREDDKNRAAKQI